MAFGPVRRTNTTALLEMDHIPTRAGMWKYQLLGDDLSVLGEFDVSRARPPKIRNDTSRKIKRTLSGLEIDPVTQSEIDTITEMIRPVHILEDGTEYPMGAFRFVDASRSRLRPGIELDGSLHDQLFILDQKNDKTVSFTRGRNVSTALELLADRYGIRRTNIESTPKTITAPKAWPSGEATGLEMMEDLCALGGFLSPYFDNHGVLVIQSVPLPRNVVPDFVYDIGTAGTGRIVADTPVESDDLLDAPNKWVVIDDAATGSPKVGVYELPDESPISIARRGFAVTSTKSVQGLHDQAAADTAARKFAFESKAGYPVSFDAIPDYRHDTWNIVSYVGKTYREIGWEVECDPTAVMSHDIRESYA